MKKLYWKPGKISWKIHLVIAIIALLCLMSVEHFQVKIKQRHYGLKFKAASIMKDAMDVLKAFRIKNIGEPDPEYDPTGSGMIGALTSPITSNTGYLAAKQSTINPNWAAVIVMMLTKAGVHKGDTIATGFSGSFPMMNLAVLSAAEAMNLKVVGISSAAGSTWGANIDRFTWLDMEQILKEKKILSNWSVAASLGGAKDRALGMSQEGKRLLRNTIDRYNIELIYVKKRFDNIEKRMNIYQVHAGDQSIKAFINVGGGTISIGGPAGKKLFKSGVNLKVPKKIEGVDGIMSRFAKQDTPVIHISGISKLAARYKMPMATDFKGTIPSVGEGDIFIRYEYNPWLVITMLLLISLMLILFIKMDIGYRIFANRKTVKTTQPSQMV